MAAVCMTTVMALSVMRVCVVASSTGNAFNITTRIGDDNQVIRIYEKETKSALSSISVNNDDFAETKALLLQLGMEQYAIDNLSTEDLEKYTDCKKIVSTVSYSKVDKNNNLTYLPESDVIVEAEQITINQNEKIQNTTNCFRTSDQDTYEDSYMRVFFMTTYHTDDSYTFSTDARWLTMPAFRWTDVIGASAQLCTVTPNSRSGYVEYDRVIIGAGTNSTTPVHNNLSSSTFGEANDGTFFGSGAKIDLPCDAINSSGTSMYYQNYKAHYQYDGHITDPSVAHYFNAVGSYTHSRATLSFSPSISIGADGVSGALGIGVSIAQDVRNVLLEIYYS